MQVAQPPAGAPTKDHSYNERKYKSHESNAANNASSEPANSIAINLITQGQYKQGPVGANLFIFHLPNEWSDLDLFYFFESFKLGTIVSVRIMTDKQNGRSKGYGFVSYDNA